MPVGLAVAGRWTVVRTSACTVTSCGSSSNVAGVRPVVGRARTACAAFVLALWGCAQTTIRGPTPVQPTNLEVASESIDVDCVGSRVELACTVRTRTRVENPGDQSDGVDIEVEASRASEMRVAVDGADTVERLLGGKVKTHLAVPPMGHRTVTMKADVTLRAYGHVWSDAALVTRHRWLGEDPWETTASMRVCPGSGHWGHARPSSIHVVVPHRWTFESDGTWNPTDDGGMESESRSCSHLRWHPKQRDVPVYHGGPVLGAGATLGDGFRGRLGYEAGISDWLVVSALVDSDLDESVVIAPVLEAATPYFLFLPSVGAGVGVPIRVQPDTAAGVRGQLTVTWGVGASLSVDYYPSDDDWQTTLMAQIGL